MDLHVLSTEEELCRKQRDALQEDCDEHGKKIVRLETDFENIKELMTGLKASLDSANLWLRGVVGSLLVAMILLLFHLIKGGP